MGEGEEEGEGGEGVTVRRQRVGAIKFTIAGGQGRGRGRDARVRYVIERAHRVFEISRPMFIFDINLVDVCGPRRSLHYFN